MRGRGWHTPPLRVGLVAGTLGVGGAEKQLVYVARALLQLGVDLRLFTLTQGEHHAATLDAIGVSQIWLGRYRHPLVRLSRLSKRVLSFRPHLLQSTHFFVNLYTALAGRASGSLAIGSLRNDVHSELHANPRWGSWLLRLPPTIVANAEQARRNAEQWGRPKGTTFVLPNVIDLCDFDQLSRSGSTPWDGNCPVVIAVGRLVPNKRFDRFLKVLALVRREVPNVEGAIVGEGPERASLERQAAQLKLQSAVRFLGCRDDIAGLLRRASVLAVTSDHEGVPNVILEAMAARLPVVTTPAGDAPQLVDDRKSGFVVPFDDAATMAARMIDLLRSVDLCRRMGEAGRWKVQNNFSFTRLPARLLEIYEQTAVRHQAWRVSELVRQYRADQ